MCVKHYSATTNAKTFKKKRKKGQALFAPASKSISPASRVSQSLTLIPVSSALLSSRPPSPAPPQARLPQLPGPLPPAAHPSGPASSVLWLAVASPRLPEDVPIEKREQKAPFAVSPRRRGASSFEEPAKEGKGPALKKRFPGSLTRGTWQAPGTALLGESPQAGLPGGAPALFTRPPVTPGEGAGGRAR